jgi:hypothetical protein
LGTLSPCETHDATISVVNTECNSITLTGWTLSQQTEGYNVSGSDSTPILLAPGDTTSLLITFDGSHTGTLYDTVLVSVSASSNSTWRIPIQTFIPGSDQTLALDTTPVDLGVLSTCETRDTSIPFANTGCVPITVSSLALTQSNMGYGVSDTGNRSSVTLAPGESDSLRITFDGSRTGKLYDTVVVIAGINNDSIRRIPIQTFIQAVDSVRFYLQTLPSLIPGQHFAVDVMPDRVVSASKGLTSVSGRLSYFDNDFAFDSITAAAGLQFQKSGLIRNNGVDEVDFSVSNANGIALDPSTPIVQIWLEPVLTDSVNYSIGLDSLLLNGGDPEFSNCTLATAATGTSPQLGFACGDSIIVNALLGRNLFYASLPAPNPLGADGDVAQMSLQSFANGNATIEIYDALGRTVHSESYSLEAGQIFLCPVDLQGSPAGGYFYTVRFLSSTGNAASSGSIILMR